MKLLNYFILVRWYNIFIAILAVYVTFVLIESQSWHNLLICALEVTFAMAFANIMNDVLDIEVDKLNHPKRMLVEGLINIKKAKVLCSIFLILTIVTSFFLGTTSKLFIYFYVLPSLISYNLFFKEKPIIGNIIVSSLLGSVFIFTELSLTNEIKIMIVPFLLAFNLSFIREFIKDIHDSFGDKKNNMNTLPIILGVKKSILFISIYIMFSIFLFLIPYIIKLYNINYLIALFFLIEIPLIYSLFLLFNNPEISTFRQLTLLHKFLAILGLFVIYLTKN